MCHHFRRVTAAIAAGIIPLSTVAAEAPRVYSVCEIAAAGSQLLGKTVRVRAVFETDKMERSGIYDDKCPAVAFDLFSGERHDKSVDVFEEAIWKRKSYRYSMDFSAVVKGAPPPGPMGGGERSGSLYLVRVWRFSGTR